jgi:hypothetical protein
MIKACFKTQTGAIGQERRCAFQKEPALTCVLSLGRGFLATFSGILLRHSFIQSRVFLGTGTVTPSPGGEGWGEDGR